MSEPDAGLPGRPLRGLHLEQNEADALAILAQLSADGLSADLRRITSRQEFLLALDADPPDLVFTDYGLPELSALGVIELVRGRWPWVPVLVVSSPVGEEAVGDLLEAGAAACILKHRLARLPGALRRALQDAEGCRPDTAGGGLQTGNALLEASPLPVIALDLKGLIRFWNPAAERVFGYPPEEVLGRRLPLLPPALEQEYDALLRHALAGEAMNGLEAIQQHRDGTSIPVNIWAAPRLNHQGVAVGLVAVCEDLRPRRQASAGNDALRRPMQESERLESLGVLAGGLAHDLDNLLASILRNAGLAAMESAPESALRSHIRQIEQAACRAGELTARLLAHGGRGRFRMEPLDLSQLVRESVPALRTAISRHAELSLQLPNGLPLVEGDAARLRELLIHLVTNGAEAMGDRGGVVRIRTDVLGVDSNWLGQALVSEGLLPGEHLLLEIRDSGEGVTAEERQRMLGAFHTTRATGRGLGLSAAFGIVEGHGGAIRAESVPGRGTTVQVLLPLRATPDPAEAHARGGPQGRGSGGG